MNSIIYLVTTKKAHLVGLEIIPSITWSAVVNSPEESATILYREEKKDEDINLSHDLYRIDLDALKVERMIIPKIVFVQEEIKV